MKKFLFNLQDPENASNLAFLLNISDATLFDWSSKMGDDDLFYGVGLLESLIVELQQKIQIIKIEHKLKFCEKINTFPHADRYIKRILDEEN